MSTAENEQNQLGVVRVSMRRMGQRLQGHLRLTKHHMVFRDSSSKREVWVCHAMIAGVTRVQSIPTDQSSDTPPVSSLRVQCRDFVFFTLEFESISVAKAIYRTLELATSPAYTSQLYAFFYSPGPEEKSLNGWAIYDAEAEYKRMGLFASGNGWRLSRANEEFAICATYPSIVAVPESISDAVLAYAAKFRSKSRFPALSYLHSLNRCTISRCAQPLIGIKQARNVQDEKLIHDIFATTAAPSGTWGAGKVDNMIIDLRPSTNALAQTAIGGGTENMDRYKPARKIHLGIDNLHVMRDSLSKVVDALRHCDVSDAPPSPASLERSNWLGHINSILAAAAAVVDQVHYRCSHVLIHCSDGWDRTPQISSLAMMLLDPYYRTLEGFMVLVEKEWASFGHQFATRGGFVGGHRSFSDSSDDIAQSVFNNVSNFISDATRNRQTGPIFQQWLDCVFQCLYAHPHKFEFNERFLKRLLYQSYSCQYGTFLFNSDRERQLSDARKRTRSVWDYFLARRAQFVDEDFVPEPAVLTPPQRARWWAGAFLRSDSDMNDPEAWRRCLCKASESIPEQALETGSMENKHAANIKASASSPGTDPEPALQTTAPVSENDHQLNVTILSEAPNLTEPTAASC